MYLNTCSVMRARVLGREQGPYLLTVSLANII